MNCVVNINKRSVIGCYNTYPLSCPDSSIEGGLRTKGVNKSSKTKYPLVSIITTTFNRGSVIEKAMCSVFEQTYPNIEYVVIDAASSDQTLDVLHKYEDKIDYFLSEPDSGMYVGMNKGLELAHGDYIIILNSDDWYEPFAIEKLVSSALTGNLDLVCALATETDWYGKIIRKIHKRAFNENVLMRMPLRHETMMISRELYEKTGLYDTAFKILGDLKKTQQLFLADVNYEQLDDYIMHFRNTGAASSLTVKFVAERAKLIAENFVMLNADEVALLANEYKRDPKPYAALCFKFQEHRLFVLAVKWFMAGHGVKL
jgi:glycosyltransferase involved in cell wall biosynthesis